MGILLAGFAFVAKHLWHKVETLSERSVTKDELREILETQKGMHEENRADLGEIKESIRDNFREIYAKIDKNNDAMHELAAEVAFQRGRENRSNQPKR